MSRTFVIAGTITNRGGDVPFVVALQVSVTVHNTSESYVFMGDTEADANGAFSFEHKMPLDRMEAFGAAANVDVTLSAYAPGVAQATRQYAVIAALGIDQTLAEASNFQTGDISYDIDLSGLSHYLVTASYNADDPPTLEAFERVDSMLCELMHSPAGLVEMPLPFADFRVPSELVATAPGFRGTHSYAANLICTSTDLDIGEHYIRFRSDGRDFMNEVVVRTLPMTGRDALDADAFGLVVRVDEAIGVGTISSSFDDRIFQSPFIIQDMDLDFVGGELRIRAGVGIGTGANLVLLTIGSVDVRMSLDLVNYELFPFTDPEFDELFEVEVTDFEFDMLPGTDLDDLPWWVYLIIAPFSLGLAGAAAIIAAVEAIVTPIARQAVEDEVLSQISDQARDAIDDAIDDQINQMGDLPPDTVALLRDTIWFEGEQVTLTNDDFEVTGWAGIWHALALLMSDGFRDSCPFDDDGDDHGDDDGRRTAIPELVKTSFRVFEDILDVPELEPWMDEYRSHTVELGEIFRGKPKIWAMVGNFAVKDASLLKSGREAVVSEKTVERYQRLSRRTKKAASPELSAFITRIDGVMKNAAGRTVAQLVKDAAQAAPTRKERPGLHLGHIGRGAGPRPGKPSLKDQRKGAWFIGKRRDPTRKG